MVSIALRVAFVASILLACGETAYCENSYSDPSGFSFTYPDGWRLITRAMTRDSAKILPPEFNNWAAENNVDFDTVSIVLLRDGHGEFLENLNVVVVEEQIPLSDRSVKDLSEQLPNEYRSRGASMDNINVRRKKVGSCDAIVAEFFSRIPGVPFRLRQKQAMIPGGGKTYIVTCTAEADAHSKHEATFDQILASFNVPAPTSQGFNLNRTLMMGLVGGIVGGLIGLVSWLKKKFSNEAT